MEAKVLITASREGVTYNEIARHLSIAIYDLANEGFTKIVIMHGGARGGDSYAEEFINKTKDTFRSHGINVSTKVFPVRSEDWNKYGKAAGPLRNKRMVDEGPVKVLAFPRGAAQGTRQCINYAKSKNIPVEEY